jgi:hypothetical protein
MTTLLHHPVSFNQNIYALYDEEVSVTSRYALPTSRPPDLPNPLPPYASAVYRTVESGLVTGSACVYITGACGGCCCICGASLLLLSSAAAAAAAAARSFF